MAYENWWKPSVEASHESGQSSLRSEYVHTLFSAQEQKLTQSQSREVSKQRESNEDQTTEASRQRVDAVKDKYGVFVREKDGLCEYTVKANGAETVVATSKDLSQQSLEQVEQQLQKSVASEKQRLEARYNIRFADSQDKLDVNQGPNQKKEIPAREPRLDELVALKAALSHSEPSNLANDREKKLLVFFAAEDTGPRARFDPDHNGNPYEPTGQPALYVFPKSKGAPATEADKSSSPNDQNPSLEWILTHELAHNHQAKTGWQQGTNSEKERALEMGWVPGKDDQGYPTWEIKGKDGFVYMQDIDFEKQTIVYRRKSSVGQYIDESGKPVKKKEQAYSLTEEQMRENALVKPYTSKVSGHPAEPSAEAMTAFRISAAQRKQLQKENKYLYELIRKNDQMEIDKNYGTNSDGSPKMIRMPSGELAPNTDRNRGLRDNFEK